MPYEITILNINLQLRTINRQLYYSLKRRKMRTLNKSNSTPSMVHSTLENGVSIKPRKNRLQELENQVNKSRIAIENMSHTRAIETNLYHRVEDLQKDLHRCLLSINHESQKQKTLFELTNILKGQMSAVQAVQKTSEQFVSCGIEKKIKKVQYDIKQILHKYNEEIAKINQLKEQANASRDERVVYSNLFNKIQKQIKHYEEIYKQTLIKNQIFLDKKRTNSIKNNLVIQEADPIDESIDKCESIQFRQTSSSKKDLKQKEQSKSIKLTDRGVPQVDPFLTNPKQILNKPSNKSAINTFYKDQNGTPQKNHNQSRGIQAAIKKKEAAIEAIAVTAQCRSMEEVLKVYSGLDKQNQDLIEDITQLDQNIEYLQQEIDRTNRQKRSSEVYENRQLSQMVNMSKNCRANKSAVRDTHPTNPHQLLNITKKICKLLDVDCDTISNDVMKEIDMKIDNLGCTVVRRHERRDSRTLISDEFADKGVCELLDKIDRFGESEKIFDQNMLRAEYHKELNKVKKRGKKSG